MRKFNKIFVIGLSKAGTNSISRAFEILGFKSCHHAINKAKISKVIKENILNKIDPLYGIKDYDVFTDFYMPLRGKDSIKMVKRLEKCYPHSLFIFLTRNKEDWIKSIIKWNQKHNLFAPPSEQRSLAKKKYLNLYEQKHRILDYFKNRKDFLLMDICGGDGWEKLCGFLKIKTLNKKFPKENRSPGFSQGTLNKLKKFLEKYFKKEINYIISIIHKSILRYFLKLSPPKKVLFDLRGFGIGNVIQVTPTIIALKKLYPKVSINLLTEHKYFLKNWKIINKILLEEESKISEYNLIFSYKYHLNLLKYIPLKLTFKENEAIGNFKIIRSLGYSLNIPPKYFPLKKTKLKFPKDKIKIGIIDCGGKENSFLNGESKLWPYFPKLINLLIKNYNCQIYLIGGDLERKRIKIKEDKRITNCLGKYSLPETAHIIKKCDFVIGNDCGPIHIAEAVGTKHYIIWGPTSEIKNGSLSNYHNIYNRKAKCRPCQGKNKKKKCKHLKCLYDLKPEEVIKEIGS